MARNSVKTDRGHLLLLDWGQWRVQGAGLGYPSSTTIGRVMTDGLGMGGDFGPRTPNYDGDVMLSRLDAWLHQQPKDGHLLAVAWVRYVGSDGYGLPEPEQPKAVGLGKSQFYTVLSNVRRQVKHWREHYHHVYDPLDETGIAC